MANSVGSEPTAPIGAVSSGSTLFASILNSSVMVGYYLQRTTSADNIFRCIFFLGTLRANRRSSQCQNKHKHSAAEGTDKVFMYFTVLVHKNGIPITAIKYIL